MENLIGKRVTVTGVNTPFEKNVKVVGLCTFIGENKFLNKKQVTLERTPIFIENFNQVKELIEK